MTTKEKEVARVKRRLAEASEYRESCYKTFQDACKQENRWMSELITLTKETANEKT